MEQTAKPKELLVDIDVINQLLDLLKKNKKAELHGNVEGLVDSVNFIENSLNAVIKEFEKVKLQLNMDSNSAPNSKVKVAAVQQANIIEDVFQKLKTMLNAIKQKFEDIAQNIVDKVRDTGISALDKTSDFMNLKENLTALNQGINDSMSKVNKNIDTVNSMTQELNAATKHIKNIGKAMTGKERDEYMAEPSESVVKPLRAVNNILANIESKSKYALNKIDALSKRANQIEMKNTTEDEANLSDTNEILVGADLTNTRLGSDDFKEIFELHSKWLNDEDDGIKAVLINSDLRNADFSNVDLSVADLNGADLSNANLTGADFTNAVLSNSNLTSADLRNANLYSANLRVADLTGADLADANLRVADLTSADLTGANLINADLTDADLFKANLEGANLTGANLTNVDLTGVNLTNAILVGADLTNTRLGSSDLVESNDINFTNDLYNKFETYIKNSEHFEMIDYILPSNELPQSLPESSVFKSITDFGGSEGIYIDISYTDYDVPNSPVEKFATIKTLENSGNAFLQMTQLGAISQLILNGNGEEFTQEKNITPKNELPLENKSDKKTIYVCSPLAGEIQENIKNAREYGKFVAEQGGVPIAPHITELFDDTIPKEREMGLSMGIDYLRKSDELWVFGDRISSGMANEIKIAQEELHIPVYQIDVPSYEVKPFENKEDLSMARYNQAPKDNVTSEQINLAKQVDLLNYVQASGLQVKPHGSGTYKLMQEGHDSTIIFPEGNSWFNYNDQVGGDSISFVMKQENVGFVQAVKNLTGEASNFRNMNVSAQQTRQKNEKSEMVLPPKDDNNKRAFAYLIKTRGIDRDLVKDCIDDGTIYQSREVIEKGDNKYTFNNCVFVGKDKDDKAMYASQRSMNDKNSVFKADVKNSSKEHGFCLKGDNDATWLTVCEAPIDALSIASSNKLKGEDNKNEHILSLGGVSDKAIDTFLEDNKNIKVINLCLDNDSAGHNAGDKIKAKYEDLGYKVVESYPKEKDYNLQLLQERDADSKPKIDLPAPSADSKRSYMYLTNNKFLNKDIVSQMIADGDMYQTLRPIPNSDKFFADTVFIQKDEKNNPIYGIGVSYNKDFERADFKIEYANYEQTKNYISREGNSDSLFVFSNPISMITQMSINKDLEKANGKNLKPHMLCALANTDSAVAEYLSTHKNIKEVKVSLDKSLGRNNKTNQPVDFREFNFNKISKKCTTNGVKVSKKFPEGKSLNHDYANCKSNAMQKSQSKTQPKNQEKAQDKKPYSYEIE